MTFIYFLPILINCWGGGGGGGGGEKEEGRVESLDWRGGEGRGCGCGGGKCGGVDLLKKMENENFCSSPNSVDEIDFGPAFEALLTSRLERFLFFFSFFIFLSFFLFVFFSSFTHTRD